MTGERVVPALFAVALAIGLSSCTSTTSPTQSSSPNFNDPDTLAQSIADKANDEPGALGTDTVTCLASGVPHEFTCNVANSQDGSTDTITATVSGDGTSWITSDGSG